MNIQHFNFNNDGSIQEPLVKLNIEAAIEQERFSRFLMQAPSYQERSYQEFMRDYKQKLEVEEKL